MVAHQCKLLKKRSNCGLVSVWKPTRTHRTHPFCQTPTYNYCQPGRCEQVFSDLKVKQTQCCNQLGLRKLAKMTKVSMDFISCIVIELTIHPVRLVPILRLNISHSGLQRLTGSAQSINWQLHFSQFPVIQLAKWPRWWWREWTSRGFQWFQWRAHGQWLHCLCSEMETYHAGSPFWWQETAGIMTDSHRNWCQVCPDASFGWGWRGSTARWWRGWDSIGWWVQQLMLFIPNTIFAAKAGRAPKIFV